MHAFLGQGSTAVNLANRAVEAAQNELLPLLALIRSLISAATAAAPLAEGGVPLPPPPPPLDALLRVRIV